MNGFNPGGEAYVSPHHMMSFVGLESSSSSNTSSQRQQLWDWETTTPPPNTTAYQAPFFANNFDSASFYGFAASPSLPVAMGGAGGRGNAGYPFQPVQAITTDNLMRKSEVDRERQVIGLNLGHRTYFPAAAAGRGGAVNHLFWRSRGVCCQVGQGQVPRCQAEGCKADLSGAKHYHRRHKVCELHSKATVVVAGGLQQRFCQQCSRFHLLSEFDEAKRSCRKRLAEHNRRRRKSQPPPVASANSDRSTPPDTSTNSTEKSKQTSPKSAKNTAATKDNITTTATSMSTASTLSQANISKERPKDYRKTATHLRNGPALSLGGAEGADKGGFGFPTPYHRQQMPWAVMSDENNSPQQPTQLISLSSAASIFVQSQNFCAGATEASQSTTAGDAQSNLLQLGQGLLEVDFI